MTVQPVVVIPLQDARLLARENIRRHEKHEEEK
jgi:hypothetical protein